MANGIIFSPFVTSLLGIVILIVAIAVYMKVKGITLFRVAYCIFVSRVGRPIQAHFLRQHPNPHSNPAPSEFEKFSVVPVPFGEDNYAYLLIDNETGCVAAVDPAGPAAVLEALHSEEERRLKCATDAGQQGCHLRLTHILTTHKHWDHAYGNKPLQRSHAAAPLQVVGGVNDNVCSATLHVSGGDEVSVGSLTVRVLDLPCHTRGHVAYYVPATDTGVVAAAAAAGLCEEKKGGGAEQTAAAAAAAAFRDATAVGEGEDEGDCSAGGGDYGVVFTGDTLFVGGVGKFFEGTARQMHANLYSPSRGLASLPPSTRLFPGHEYTVSNLLFAAWVEPENPTIQQKLAWAQRQRAVSLPTVPSTLAQERGHNPFMRVHLPAVSNRVQALLRGAPSVSLPRDTGLPQQPSSPESALLVDVETVAAVNAVAALRALKNAGVHLAGVE